MTDTIKLKERISKSGYKLNYLAEQLGLSRQGLYLKVNGSNDFTTTEVQRLCDLLSIDSLKERNNIFFAPEVDK